MTKSQNVIFLIGFMGSGKTTLGKAVAKAMNFQFIDMDEEIEKQAGKTVAEIFEEDGESTFRKLEREFILNSANFNNTIFSTGGGAPCFGDNMNLINSSGTSVYLKYTPEVLFSRLRNATNERPLLAKLDNDELRTFIEDKISEREPYYSQARIVYESNADLAADVEKFIQMLSSN